MKLITPCAADLGRPNVVIKHFADTESYVQIPHIESLKNKPITLYHRLYPEPEKRLFELLLILSKLEAKSCKLFTPYLPYARQDRENKKGEAVSADVLCRLLKNAGVEKLITYDCHFLPKSGRFKRAGLKIENLSAGVELYKYAKKYFGSQSFVVVSPDEGASYFTKHAQDHSFQLKKVRKEHNHVHKIDGHADVKGKNVCILDDIIDTGGTIRRAIDHLRKLGAKKIIVGATHGIFSKGKIKEADFVFTTNSIENSHSVIWISGKY